MYCLQIGRGMVVGHVTAGDLWQNKNLQVRCRGALSPSEFQERLNKNEKLKFYAATVWLKGEPVYDDIDAYLESYKFSLSRHFTQAAYGEADLSRRKTVEDIHSALLRVGVPDETPELVRYLLEYFGVRSSYRFPALFADKITFESLAIKVIEVYGRQRAVEENRIPEYDEVWRITGLTDILGARVEDDGHKSLLNREVSLLLVSRGTGLVMEMVTDSTERILCGSTVLYIDKGKDGTLSVTTRNSVYHFTRTNFEKSN